MTALQTADGLLADAAQRFRAVNFWTTPDRANLRINITMLYGTRLT